MKQNDFFSEKSAELRPEESKPKATETKSHFKNGAHPKRLMRMGSFLIVACFVLSTLFSGCKNKDNDDTVTTTTVDEDKANIQKSFDNMKSLIQNFRSGSVYKLAEDLAGIGMVEEDDYRYVGENRGDYTYTSGYNHTPGQGDYIYHSEWDYYEWVGEGLGDYSYFWGYEYTPGQGDYIKDGTYTYFDVIIPELTETMADRLTEIMPQIEQIGDDYRFNFAAASGKYTWNNSSQSWNKTSLSTIQLLFPSNAGSASNNCEFAITEYTDKMCNIEGENMYLPTKVKAYLNANGTKIVDVNANATFSDYGIPQDASVSVYAKPITITCNAKQESTTRYSASASIKDETNSANSLSVSGEITLANQINNYSDVDDIDVNYIKATIIQDKMTIKGTIDLRTINNISNPNASDINSCMYIEVLYNNAKIGTLKIEELGQYKDRYLFIYYKDGSKENTEIYYDKFITDIENILLNK